jgi:hypothetical protein
MNLNTFDYLYSWSMSIPPVKKEAKYSYDMCLYLLIIRRWYCDLVVRVFGWIIEKPGSCLKLYSSSCGLHDMRVILRVFAKLRIIMVGFVMYVCLSIGLSVCPSLCLSAWINSAPTARVFEKFDISVIFFFRKSVEKSQHSLNSNKNKDLFTWRPIHIFFNRISLSSY